MNLARLVCLVVGHRLVTRGPLMIEGQYVPRVECARCHAGRIR